MYLLTPICIFQTGSGARGVQAAIVMLLNICVMLMQQH